MKLHRWLDLKVTRRCNNFSQKCTYCDVPIDPLSAPEVLSLESIHTCLLDARALGFDIFWLLGGEPSMRADCDQLVGPLADDPGVMITIVTNGKWRADAMYQSLFATRARRACVQVSLDTLEPGNHKRADPASSLKLISDLHQMAQAYSHPAHQCEVEVHCVISRENHQSFHEFVRFFAAKATPVSLAMVCPWTTVPNPTRFNEFTRAEVDSICQRIETLQTGLAVDAFNPHVASFARGLLRNDVGWRSQEGCGAGLTHLVINGDGSVHRCMAESFRPLTSLGSITTERLHRILRRLDRPRFCETRADCFDGYAWDKLALDNQ